MFRGTNSPSRMKAWKARRKTADNKTLTSWTVCCNAESNLIRIDFVIGSLVSTDFERLWEPLRIFLTMKEWVGSKTLYNLWT